MRRAYRRLRYIGRFAALTLVQLVLWLSKGFASPAPAQIKRQVLLRNSCAGAAWIETGTYLGDMTSFLSRHFPSVHSVEVDPHLASAARRRFEGNDRVTILQGDSGTILRERICDVFSSSSGRLNLWLDGHFSGGVTGKAGSDTPIVSELNAISDLIRKTPTSLELCVFVDDVRCFDPTQPGCADFPDLNFLVDWARTSGAKWHIEHDIFVAKIAR